jgi:hypothetical protein
MKFGHACQRENISPRRIITASRTEHYVGGRRTQPDGFHFHYVTDLTFSKP